jgi:hypothetical protein
MVEVFNKIIQDYSTTLELETELPCSFYVEELKPTKAGLLYVIRIEDYESGEIIGRLSDTITDKSDYPHIALRVLKLFETHPEGLSIRTISQWTRLRKSAVLEALDILRADYTIERNKVQAERKTKTGKPRMETRYYLKEK